MFSSKQYRAKAAEYRELGKNSDGPKEAGEFRAMEGSFTALADNADWLARNHTTMVYEEDHDGTYRGLLAGKPKRDRDALSAEEQHVLRCLGAAVIMQWNSLSKELQRALFDNA